MTAIPKTARPDRLVATIRARRQARNPASARATRGVTLVELMIALVVQSIFILFVLGMYSRMSSAYRAQSSVSDVQQSLQAARLTLLPEIERAGFGLPDGFKAQDDNLNIIPALAVTNNADGSGPDALRFFYADSSAQARVTSFADANRQFVTVDFVDNFVVGDVAVLVNPRMVPAPGGISGAADIAQFDACVIQISAINAGTNNISFSSAMPLYNSGTNSHCTDVQTATQTEAAQSETMLYRFVGRTYRIDPTRKDLSVLQMSPSGGLVAADWVDMGIGFTDLQIATRYFEDGDAMDLDGDGDPQRDWYSSEGQETPDPTLVRPAGAVVTHVSVSIVARSTHEIDVVPTAQTPSLIDNTSPQTVAHNRLGDHDSFTLFGVPDASRPVELRGNHVFRFSSSTVDVRNMGVGR